MRSDIQQGKRTLKMRMYFELIRDAAGQTNQPYDRSIRELNMHTRRGPKRMGSRGVYLLLGWISKSAPKPLSFAPRKASEFGSVVHDDEYKHRYWPTLNTRRSISRSASSVILCPWFARYCATTRSTRR